MDVAFADDRIRVRAGHAAHNLAILKHITLNLIRLDPIKRKGASRPDVSAPQPPMPIANISSASLELRAIALTHATRTAGNARPGLYHLHL